MIVVALSLVVIVSIVSNIFLWNFEMNQLDYEKNKEDLTIISVDSTNDDDGLITFKNKGSLTAHVISLWVNNSTYHQRYEMNLFINGGETKSYSSSEINSQTQTYIVKAVTERGNIALLSTESNVNSTESIVTYSDPDSAAMLKDITAESGRDSSASDSENILNLMTDDDLSGAKEIFNFADNNKDYAHSYQLTSEASDYSKVEVGLYFSTLEVTPYEWRVFVYQSDGNNINTGYYVDGSSSSTGWTTIDVSSIMNQLDGQGFMKVRLISRIGNGNEGKKAYISEMEWKLTS